MVRILVFCPATEATAAKAPLANQRALSSSSREPKEQREREITFSARTFAGGCTQYDFSSCCVGAKDIIMIELEQLSQLEMFAREDLFAGRSRRL